ncbi:hypothetical protein BDZ94DRAFT_1302106 [Collybia nuda]|uniref:Uncharacterized protein n=1 Tax=Collybia nuda TaxID=64659 RepID=A0A9P5XUB5_9AGAR|nr:hypothetical protein BDZ94DRAFT_1302106 [Collybia nuda]
MILGSGKSFWLDYFEIGMEQPPGAETSVSSHPSATGTTDWRVDSSTASVESATVGASTTATPAMGPSVDLQPPTVKPSIDSQSSTPPISAGLIAGVVVGSMAIIILIGIAIWLYSQKQKDASESVLQ